MNASPPLPVDLQALIGADVRLQGRGRERWAPCPKCGGVDRFHVNVAEGWWFCRECSPKRGDAPGYLMWRDGLRYPEAVARLEGMPAMPVREHTPAARALAPGLRHALHEKIRACCGAMEDAARARAWLANRGIDDAAIAAWDLGLHAGEPGGSTPLDVPAEDGGKPSRVAVAHGITIPLMGVDGQLHGLSVRRATGKPKYLTVAGSLVPLFGKPPRHPVCLIVEGWLDAILLHHLAGDLVDVAALGTARADVDERWSGYLLAHRRWLVCMDADEAGRKATAGWLAWSGRAVAWEVQAGKDASEWWQLLAAESDAETAGAVIRANLGVGL